MSDCTHDLAERESACADGYCPLCLVADLAELRAGITALSHDTRRWADAQTTEPAEILVATVERWADQLIALSPETP